MKFRGRKQVSPSLPSWKLWVIMLVILPLAACQSLSFNVDIPFLTPAASQTPTSSPLQEKPTRPATQTPETTPTSGPRPQKLTIWVPRLLDPEMETDAARLFRARLDAFGQAHGVLVEVRVKSQVGTGSLLDSLRATKAAAPALLPDLVAFPKQDLLSAVAQELIYTDPALDAVISSTDWYPYARQVAFVNESAYAVPFMADPFGLVYDSKSQLVPVGDWTGIKDNFGFFGFAADDPQSIFLLMLYLSMGGKVEDPQGRIILEQEPLTQALQLLKDTSASKHLSNLAITFQSSDQVWGAFTEWKLNTAVVPVSNVLTHVAGRVEQPTPGLVAPSITMTNAWMWALGNPDPERKQLAVSLAEYLVDPAFLAEWSELLGQLPARPSALTAWTGMEDKPTLDKISQVAILFPREEILNVLGPILRNATLSILRDGGQPEDTAAQAMESVP